MKTTRGLRNDISRDTNFRKITDFYGFLVSFHKISDFKIPRFLKISRSLYEISTEFRTPWHHAILDSTLTRWMFNIVGLCRSVFVVGSYQFLDR